MSGARCDDAAFERTADEGHVAHYVKQFVACRFIVEFQRGVRYAAELGDLHRGETHQRRDVVKVLLRHFAVVDDYGIVEVATLDEVGLQQRLDFAHEHESAACGNLVVEVCDVLKTCKLVCQHR